MPLFDLAGDRVLLEILLLVAKATLVMAGALVISRTLLRRDPAARHALWTGTMLALLLLPLVSVVGTPGVEIRLPVLPSSAATSLPSAPGEGMVAGERAEAGPEEAAAAGDPAPMAATEPAPGMVGEHPAPGVADPEAIAVFGGRADPSRVGAAPALSVSRPGVQRVASGLGVLWLSGLALFLLALGAGLLRARRLIQGARPVADAEWDAEARAAASRVGLRGPVSLRTAPGVVSPMAGGILRPVVLLPSGAGGWSRGRREVVLLHEFVHVRRRDPLRQLLDRVVVALYWFHPLARVVAREAAAAREEACDRRVIELGAGPSAYASHLVELTDLGVRSPVGLTGFHHPNLEKRVMAILSPSPSSRRTASLGAGLLALAWFGVVAAGTPVASQTPPPVPPSPGHSEPMPPPSPPVDPVVAAPFPSPPVPLAPMPAQGSEGAPAAEPTASPGSAAALFAGPPDLPPPPPPNPGDHEDLRACEAPGPGGAGTRAYLRSSETEAQSRMFHAATLGEYGVCLFTVGSVRLAEEGFRAGAMASGSSAELVVASTEGRQRLYLQADESGAVRSTWYVNEVEQPMGPEVERWRDAILAVFRATTERGQLRGQEARLRGEMARMNGERARLRGEVARAQGQVALLSGERSRLAGQEARLRGEVSRLQGEISRLRGQRYRITDPQELRELETRIEERVARAAERTAEIEAEIQSLDTANRLPGMDREIERTRGETDRAVRDLRARIDALEVEHEARRLQIEEEIQALDVQARVARIDGDLPELRARAISAIEALGFSGGAR